MIGERECMIIHGPRTLADWLRTRNEGAESSIRRKCERLHQLKREEKEDKEKEQEKGEQT